MRFGSFISGGLLVLVLIIILANVLPVAPPNCPVFASPSPA